MACRIDIARENFFEYSFRNSDSAGKRIVAAALTFRNPSPFAYSDKIQMFDRRMFTFRVGMLPTLLKKLSNKGLDYRLQD